MTTFNVKIDLFLTHCSSMFKVKTSGFKCFQAGMCHIFDDALYFRKALQLHQNSQFRP